MAKRVKKKTTGKQMEFPPSDKISKSQRVRDYIAMHKGAKTSEIVEALKEHGVTKFNVAGIIYAKGKKKMATKKLGRPAGSTKKVAAHSNGDMHFSSAIAFIRITGGIEAAKRVLAQLDEIKGIL